MKDPKQFLIKDTFKLIFILFVIILIILPFATTFNELLTRLVEKSGIEKIIRIVFVPYFSNIIYRIMQFLPGIKVSSIPSGVVVNGVDVIVNWNCLGWQSFLLLGVSFLVGLRGSYTRFSIIMAVLLGISGTFLINIFRMVITAALVGWWRGLFAILFHNYFMTFVSIIWLFFFWYFSYKYILEEK